MKMTMSTTAGRRPIALLALATMLVIPGASSALAAASADEFRAAYATAEAANTQAAALRNAWTTTVSTLADAKKAADAGNFDAAVALAKEAEALAKASIFQAANEKDAWKALEIR
jgi:hypothetical protein